MAIFRSCLPRRRCLPWSGLVFPPTGLPGAPAPGPPGAASPVGTASTLPGVPTLYPPLPVGPRGTTRSAASSREPPTLFRRCLPCRRCPPRSRHLPCGSRKAAYPVGGPPTLWLFYGAACPRGAACPVEKVPTLWQPRGCTCPFKAAYPVAPFVAPQPRPGSRLPCFGGARPVAATYPGAPPYR